MKAITTILTTIVLLPLLALFNEGESILPNFLALAYLAALNYTLRGRTLIKIYRLWN